MFIKLGEVFGWYSFLSEQKQTTSFISHNFSTILEIRRSDFLKIMLENNEDYVKN